MKKFTSASSNAPLTAIDLFCGAGGLSLGASRAGLRVAAGVELDAEAISTHRINFPKSRHLNQDVAQLSGKQLLKKAGLEPGNLTALVGGPPCQGFSVMGRRNADDVRNSLFGHFMRLVAETAPSFFVAENVPGILTQANEFTVKAALARVPEHYHVLPPITIKGSDYGAPTSRTRVFFIGVDGRNFPKISPELFAPCMDVKTIKVAEALKGLPAQVEMPDKDGKIHNCAHVRGELPSNFFYDRVQGTVPTDVGDAIYVSNYKKYKAVNGHIGVVHGEAIAQRYGNLKPGEKDPISRSVRLKLDGFCPTLRAGTGSEKGRRQAVRPIHPTEARVITPREAARLQGFPDWFYLPPTKWHSFRQIGNSVSPLVAEFVLTQLVQHIASFEEREKAA